MKLSGPQGDAPCILVIAGMHRSGTSLLAALASEAGFDMGARLLAAGPGNPGGHFEDLDFLELHDAALAARPGVALRACVPTQQPDAARLLIARGFTAGRRLRPFECIGNYQGHKLAVVINLVIFEGRPRFSRATAFFKAIRWAK